MTSAQERRTAYVDKARAELAALERRGVVMVGNAFSPVLFAKGELDADELERGLLTGADGTALRAALAALGYAPEEWCALATVRADGTPLGADVLREAVMALDPATLVSCDAAATLVVREAFADELASLASMEAALLMPGMVVPVVGMRTLNLGGFAAALASEAAKQRVWAYLKQIPPLGEPF